MTDRMEDKVEVLREAATAAFRERDGWGRILPSPAWCDLAPAEREALFDLQIESRAWERLVSAEGMSGTGREVLRRVARLGQVGGRES